MMKHLKSIIPSVLIALLVAGGANAALWQWSKTAATNATADPSVNWAEGMSPSSVNDSARAMMARTAEWRDDLSGLLTTAGTSTAYTVTTNQGLASVPNDGQALAFTVHTDNGVAPTLRADGGTIYPIQSAAGTAIGAGVLVSGAPYTVKFKLASTAWVLHGFYGQPFVIPIGAMIEYTGATSPNSNFVLPFGQCISRTTYATYFALVSTLYGVCDGTTTFAVPDFRGTIAVGKDNMGGSARGLITTAGASCDGTTMGTQCGAQNVTLLQANLPNVAFAASVNGTPTGALTGITGTVAITDPGHAHAFSPASIATQVLSYQFGATTISSIWATSGSIALGIASNTTGITGAWTHTGGTFAGNNLNSTGTAASGGSGTAVNKLPPIQVVNKLLRIF